MTPISTFTIRHFAETLRLRLPTSQPASAAQIVATRSALFSLLSDFRARDPETVRVLERVHRALFAPFSRPHVAERVSAEQLERVARDLERAANAGRLIVEADAGTRSVPPRVRNDAVAPGLGPTPEPEPSSFKARFVDEIGQAISGLDVVLTVSRGPQQLTTDGDGKISLDGVTDSFGSLRISSVKALRDIVEPRWKTKRKGIVPSSPAMVRMELLDDLDSITLPSDEELLVVVLPPLGKLFLEVFDRSGRVLHANRKYKIEGPTTFEGTTDENGQLLHDDVLPGDYDLKLTLDFFPDAADAVSEEFESPLVVLSEETLAPQQRMLGAVPHVVFGRVRGFLFDTNKSFILPTASDAFLRLRDLYEQNDPSELLIVGHTDTTAEPKINDPLSLERAESVKAFLQDDVDAWLKHYDAQGKGKWGSREDRLMIAAMPDFSLRGEDEKIIEWYQRTRGLTVDNDCGPLTRKQLIAEYMSLDGVSLKDDAEFHISITTHGAGENFPLADTGFDLDTAAANEKEDPFDRRAELFFFDPEFGIRPAPGAADGPEYLEWRKNADEDHDFGVDAIGRQATVVEVHDALFRTNSCVVMPEGETPSGDKHDALTSVGIFASILRFNDEHSKKSLFVAGHTDTTNTIPFNQALSNERAKCTLALLEGDRDSFVSLAQNRHTPGDYKQILSFFTKSFADLDPGSGGFACDPGVIDDNANTGGAAVKSFQQQYNANKVAIGASSQSDLSADGVVGDATWGAIFDVLDFALQRELGEDPAGLAALREQLVFADEKRKALGFSEYYPVDHVGRDNVRSQANRRVEVFFFDPGEEPDLVLAESDPDVSELYLPGNYRHVTMDVDPTGGKRIRIAAFLHDFRHNPMPEKTPYELRIGDQIRTGTTDKDGRIEERGLVDAPSCVIAWEQISALHPPDGNASRDAIADGDKLVFLYRRTFDLTFSPNASTPTQPEAQIRLSNLGYLTGSFATDWALFERDYELAPSAPLSPDTFTKLVEVHAAGLGVGDEPADPVPSTDDATPDDFEEDDFELTSTTIELLNPDGTPAANERFQISSPEGVVAEGTLDDQGQATVGGLPTDQSLEVTFPDRDASAWATA